MGKQSKRKNKGVKKTKTGNKQEQQQQQQDNEHERKEQRAKQWQLQQRQKKKDQERRRRQSSNPKDFQKGKRALFRSGITPLAEGPVWTCGVLKSVGDSFCEILAEDYKDRGGFYQRVPFEDIRVLHETVPWTLRFEKGDLVIAHVDGRAQPGKILCQWPDVNLDVNSDMVPCYKCRCGIGPNDFVYVFEDDDESINKRDFTAFRFETGDEVIFSSKLARSATGTTGSDPWIPGEIGAVNSIGHGGPYICRFMDGSTPSTCCIRKDDDEHVASIDASPRGRLIDSIEQDCSYDHIDYLVKSFSMDVMPIRDLLLSKAIESASYDALAWLQNNTSLELARITDAGGNGLLHQIAKSIHAERFIVTASARIGSERCGKVIDLDSNFRSNYGGLIRQRNNQGSLWLHELVISGNVRAFDLALSPDGLAWIHSSWFDEGGQEQIHVLMRDSDGCNLAETANRLGHHKMEKIVNKYVERHILYELSKQLDHEHEGLCEQYYSRGTICPNRDGFVGVAVGDALSYFVGEDESSIACRLLQFYRDYGRPVRNFLFPGTLAYLMRSLVEVAHLRALSWLVKADSSVLNMPKLLARSTSANRNEFAQPELWDLAEKAEEDEYLTLASLAALGYVLSPNDVLGSINRHKYAKLLAKYAEACGDMLGSPTEHSLFEYIADVQDRYDSCDMRDMLGYKLELLGDDGMLGYKLEVLDFLVKEHGQSPPNVLDIIRWRKCGVLRWLVDGSFVDLERNTSSVSNITEKARGMQLLGGYKIPKTMTVGVFLCFAAIEFDDLRSLQWLVKDKKVPLSDARFIGWNAIHCCANFGRSEIFLWLRSLDDFVPLIRKACMRKPDVGLSVAQVAVKQGHTFLAGLLLKSGCPLKDREEKTVFEYAGESELEFVREWGIARERPSLLDRDVKRLLELLSAEIVSADAVKEHLSMTGLLYPNRWLDCDYLKVYAPGPLGKCYLEILDACCRVADAEFVVWLCGQASPPTDLTVSEGYLEWDRFWGLRWYKERHKGFKVLDCEALKEVASRSNHELLLHHLSEPFARDVTCMAPDQRNHVLRSVSRKFESDSTVSIALLALSDELLQLDILNQLKKSSMNSIKKSFIAGAPPSVVSNVVERTVHLAAELARLDGRQLDSYFSYSDIILPNGQVDLECEIPDYNYRDDHPLCGMIEWESWFRDAASCLYVFLAMEGYGNLLSWCKEPGRSTWDTEKELGVVQIAAYLGHGDIVDLFLQEEEGCMYFSSECNRFHAALLGAAEAGDVASLALYIEASRHMGVELPPDTIMSGFQVVQLVRRSYEHNLEMEKKRIQRRNSVVASAVFACLRGSNGRQSDEGKSILQEDHRRVIEWLVSGSGVDARLLVRAAAVIMVDRRNLDWYERCIALVKSLLSEFALDIWTCQEEVHQLCEAFMNLYGNYDRSKVDEERLHVVVSEWFKLVAGIGVDVQLAECPTSFVRRKTGSCFMNTFESLRAKQLQAWSQFDLIKNGEALEDIKMAVEEGHFRWSLRYKQGLLCTHLAAAYDRPDILAWLVTEKAMSLGIHDGLGRTVAEVAEASHADEVCAWIGRYEAMNVISLLVSSHFRRQRAENQRNRLLGAIKIIQARRRGDITRRTYRGRLFARFEESKRFQVIWQGSIDRLSDLSSLKCHPTWATLKAEQHDFRRVEDLNDSEDMAETTQKLEDATIHVSHVNHFSEESDEFVGPQSHDDIEIAGVKDSCHFNQPASNTSRIKLTGDVVKWLRQGDSKYRGFFIRRIEQLATGERSRILAKRLTCCKTLIYETYLEQKSGHRILWTECDDGSLLIWYVARHKNVSRLISLIDDAESRSRRQLTPASVLSEVDDGNNIDCENAVEERIMLDPLGDTPLKLYEVESDEVEKLKNDTWKPRLYLTTREREIVQTPGTVLLLGRSGTGKTCVICNRMDYDRQRAETDPSFSQLFVSRSQRLRDYVKEVVDISNTDDMSSTVHCPSTKFETFGQVIRRLESTLPVRNEADNLFLPSHRMDFGRFRREVYRPEVSGELDALVIWTNIRSFIKGSIEALLSSERVVSEVEYLDLGKRRCRLSPEQRKCVYATFQRYASYMKELRLWDDCDRVTALVQRMEHARASDSITFVEVRYSKLYVDEVQDYTQAEIALFFYLCGPGDLFLAGDPAQSVVEGVEFRFEEIRSVGYHLYGEDRRHLIPDKPKTVHLNFRSHCGILDIAAAVLSCLFQVFPDSAKQLKEDRGLFQGPRPGVFHRVPSSRLQELIYRRNGIVLLTHDREVRRVRQSLNDYPLVYGIREAKGLEFQEVILVDFFVGMPLSLQKLWRDLLLGRDCDEVSRRPEVEGQLKLLYTAITRCIQRMFFAETTSSVAGDAFVRWLTTTSTADGRKESLAIKSRVDDVEKMSRTPDEWRSAGLDNAIMAESSDDLVESEKWLDRAIYCFEQVGDTALATKARTHRSSIRFLIPLLLEEPSGEGATGETHDDSVQTEVEAARLTEKLLAEKMLVQARVVCSAVLPLMSVGSQDMLQKQVVARLPLMSDDVVVSED